MEQIAEQTVQDQKTEWIKLLTAIDIVVAEAFGKEVDAGFKSAVGPVEFKEFDVWQQEVQNWIAANVGLKIKHIGETTRQAVRDVISIGITEGESIPDIMNRLGDLYSGFEGFRSELIARTEVISSSNAGSRGAALQTGLPLDHVWLTTRDGRERNWHGAVDGQRKKLNEPFIVRGEQMMFPGDSTLGASASNVIQCRCVEVYELQTESGDEAPAGTEFIPAKTVRGAEKWARNNNLADVVDYEGSHIEVANDWNKGIWEALREVPEIRPQFRCIGTMQARNTYWYDRKVEEMIEVLRHQYPNEKLEELRKRAMQRLKKPVVSEGVYAVSTEDVIVSGITVNTRWAAVPDEFKKSLENDVKIKYHPVGCDTIKSVVDHELGHQIDDYLGISQDPEVVKLCSSLSSQETKEQLSKYATFNIQEFVAEAYAELMNNPNPRPIARQIGGIIARLKKGR